MTSDTPSAAFAPADALTLGNGIAGFLAIVTFSIETGIIPGTPDTLVASIFIGLGLVLDSLDGPAARLWGSSRLGQDLDTLCDLITFVVAPAVLLLMVYGSTTWPGAVAASVLILTFGTLRLARFNRATGTSEHHTFRGLPTPWAAVTIVILILLDAPASLALPLVAVLAFLMMSQVAYPKSRDKATILTLVTAVTATGIVLGLLLLPSLHPILLGLALGIAVFAVIASPLLVRYIHRGEAEGSNQERRS